MNITSEQIQGKHPITILSTQGDLDASNYQDLIASARQAHSAGARYLLIDMSGTPFMSSSGLVALHTVALIMQGQALPDPDLGWGALHAIGSQTDSGTQRQVKLLNPQPQVDRALEKTGLKQFFEVYTDRSTALASYGE
jgi:anti-anti-sigma regulatory factor